MDANDVIGILQSVEGIQHDVVEMRRGITDLKNVVEELIVTNKETLSRMSRVKQFADRGYVGLLKGRIDTLEIIKYLLERLIYTTNR